MPQRPEHSPGAAAPAAGTYELLNIFGEPTGIRVAVAHGHPMPQAPHGQTWRLAEAGEIECEVLGFFRGPSRFRRQKRGVWVG